MKRDEDRLSGRVRRRRCVPLAARVTGLCKTATLDGLLHGPALIGALLGGHPQTPRRLTGRSKTFTAWKHSRNAPLLGSTSG
jgi:hypothetical protein